jgi:beta-glucanase (GH16 family)
VTTANKFSFNHGYFQVRAQVPDSTTGGWFTIWFLGGSNEMDLNESGFTGCGSGSTVNQCVASNMNNGTSQKFYNANVDLSAGYHVYGMDYQPGKSVTIYLDGKPINSFTSNVPTGSYFIILTNTLANSTAAGWHTTVSNATPASFDYKISEVQVWQ